MTKINKHLNETIQYILNEIYIDSDEDSRWRCDLRGLEISNADMKQISELLTKNQHVVRLEFGSRQAFSSKCWSTLATALANNKSVRKLGMYNDCLEANGMKALAKGLKKNKSIEELKISQNRTITFDGIEGKALFDAINRHKKLKIFNFVRNRIDKSGVKTIAEGLSKNTRIKDLSLGWNNFGKNSIKLICEGLKKNDKIPIQYLRLTGNHLQGSFEFICELLKSNKQSLVYIGLAHSKIFPEEQYKFWTFLEFNKYLKIIDMDGVRMTEEGVKSLGEHLKNNSTVQKLWLGGCGLTARCCEYIADALKSSICGIDLLSIKRNPSIGAEGCKYLGEMLQKNKKLKHLAIDNCGVGDEGIHHLCESMKTDNNTLVKLFISGNNLSEKGVLELRDLLKLNICVEKVFCSLNSEFNYEYEDEDDQMKNNSIAQALRFLSAADHRNRMMNEIKSSRFEGYPGHDIGALAPVFDDVCTKVNRRGDITINFKDE